MISKNWRMILTVLLVIGCLVLLVNAVRLENPILPPVGKGPIADLQAQISQLEAENAALQAQVAQLNAEKADLQEQLDWCVNFDLHECNEQLSLCRTDLDMYIDQFTTCETDLENCLGGS